MELPEAMWMNVARFLENANRACLAQCAKTCRYAMDHGILQFQASVLRPEIDDKRLQDFVRYTLIAWPNPLSPCF